MTRQSDEQDPSVGQASTSVRVAMVFFLGTLVLLFVMGVIWMFIRVEPAQSSSAAAPGQHRGLGQRHIVVFDDNRGAFIG